MKSNWTEFLINSGAEYENGMLQHFGNPSRELKLSIHGDILTDLSHTGLIIIRGEDTEQFLQGQFTNDIRKVDDTHAQISGYCSPKGRLLSNFLIFKRSDSYFLRLPGALVEDTIKRLKMFVLMAKVTIENASDGQIHIGYCGPNAAKELAEIFTEIPQDDLATVQSDDVTLIKLPGINPRFEILAPLDRMKKIWTALNVHAAPVGAEVWSWLTIQNGLPLITPETVDAFVPQMVNMHIINGISFKKGCYTGQEIVARMHYLGKLKRRMYLAHVDTDTRPQEGESVYASISKSAQGTGKIVNVSPAPDGGFDLLAVIEISSVEAGEIHLGDVSGPTLQFMDLPYEVTELANESGQQ
jgi:folate-binding protein YgfZ